MRADEIIGVGWLARSSARPDDSLGAGWVRTSVMQLQFYGRSNTNWVPHRFHFHESGDEVRTHLVLFDFDHTLHVACR